MFNSVYTPVRRTKSDAVQPQATIALHEKTPLPNDERTSTA
jgi:hypothetical protein